MSYSVSVKEGGDATNVIGESIGRDASPASQGDNAFAAMLTLAFVSLALIGILNHEMWRDELQAWLIARDSLSISDLATYPVAMLQRNSTLSDCTAEKNAYSATADTIVSGK